MKTINDTFTDDPKPKSHDETEARYWRAASGAVSELIGSNHCELGDD